MVNIENLSDIEILLVALACVVACLAVGFLCYWVDRRNRDK